ncbi:MAG: hypothetical protein AB7O24_32815 [Kofleriaceae bacterium]
MQRSTRLTSLLLAVSAVSACADEASPRDGAQCTGGKCDGASETCNDPGYGDGVCQLDLECAAPDIDCFITFDDDATAAKWFTEEMEPRLATQESRPPRNLVGETDPRFVHTRELLDRGWEAFAASRPVADLASARPALLLVEDDQVNAHASADTAQHHAMFAVIVNSALLIGRTDEQVLAVMMHEFQHAVGLHVLPALRDRLRTYYIAVPGDEEPIGRYEDEDADARKFGTAWRTAAAWSGPYPQAELGAVPWQGEMHQVFSAALVRSHAQNQAACDPAIAAINAIWSRLGQATDPISRALIGDLSDVAADSASAQAKIEACLAVIPKGFVEFLVEDLGAPAAEVEKTLGPDGQALIDGKSLGSAIAALMTEGRSRMRTAEAGFVSELGLPWSAVRYFSYEEDADDVSVAVMRAAGMDPTGGDSVLSLLDDVDLRTQCAAMLDNNEVPPYGVDLADEHHATCWRAYHVRQLAGLTKP